MANQKKAKFNAAVKKISKNQFGDEDLLSDDLAKKIGTLKNKGKVTIRLDLRVIKSAKQEAVELGVGYQKIINDRLLEIYDLGDATYLKKDSMSEIKELNKKIRDLDKRINSVERAQDKKQA